MGVCHKLIDPMTVLMLQTNLLTSMKVVEDTMESVENGKTIWCIGSGTNRKKVSGEPRTYKTLCKGRSRFGQSTPFIRA